MSEPKKRGFLACVLIICVVILATFKDLTQTFYQQDEWHGLGLALAEGGNSVFNGISRPLDLLFVKGRILSNAIYYLFSVHFPFQNTQMAVFAIVLHIIGTLLVFALIRKLISSLLPSLLGAMFFAVNSVSHGAVTWPVVAISTVGSSIFVFLAIFFSLDIQRPLDRNGYCVSNKLVYF